MEISEIRSELRQLQDKIEELISDFEKKTKYSVSNIKIKSLTHVNVINFKTEIIGIDIDIRPGSND